MFAKLMMDKSSKSKKKWNKNELGKKQRKKIRATEKEMRETTVDMRILSWIKKKRKRK